MLLAACPSSPRDLPWKQLSRLLTVLDDAMPPQVLIFDRGALERGKDGDRSATLETVTAAELLDAGVPDHAALHRLAIETSPHACIAIDATRVEFSAAEAIVRTAGSVWYHVEEWHRGFVVICNEVDALNMGRVLAESFLIRSIPLTVEDRRRKVRGLRRRGFALQLFGSGSLLRSVYWIYQSLTRRRR